MAKAMNQSFGGLNATLGILGVFRGILVILLGSVGLFRVRGIAMVGRARLFFGLAVAEGLLVGILAGALLLTSGILLLRQRPTGRVMAVAYAIMKLLFGFLTLAAIIVFLIGARQNLAVVAALTGTRLLPGLGWTTMVLLLLTCIFGWFLALSQFLLMAQSDDDSDWDSMSATTPIPLRSTTTSVAMSDNKTQVYRSVSRTVTLHVYQNGRLKEWKQFELFDHDGRARRFVIGRAADSDLALSNDAAVSTEHCALRCDESGQLCLTDMDSANGTFIKRGVSDPRRITARTPVQHDDVLLLGYRGVSQVRVIFDWSVKRQTIFA